MKITNHAGLPEPIVNAIKNHEYSKGSADFSISELIRPPQINQLSRDHDAEITEDAADRIWALLGQAVHGVMEKADTQGSLQEERLYGALMNRVVSGQLDNLDLDAGILSDYKITSVWSVMGDLKPEWEKQLNYYCWLAEVNDYQINKIQIVAILRDWSKAAYLRSPDTYPSQNVAVVDVPLWPRGRVENEMSRDIFDQENAIAGSWRPCTDSERWFKPGKVALMKAGRKSAVKLFDTGDEAIEYVKASDISLIAGESPYSLVERPGVYRRCEDYCSVAQFCDQYKEES